MKILKKDGSFEKLENVLQKTYPAFFRITIKPGGKYVI